jgi:hypothetical protein
MEFYRVLRFGSTSGIRKHLERNHHAKHRKFIDEDKNFKQSKRGTFSLVNKGETNPPAPKTPRIDMFYLQKNMEHSIQKT